MDSRAYDPATDEIAADSTSPWLKYRPNALQRFLIFITQHSFLQRGSLRKLMSELITGISSPLDITFRECAYRISGKNNLIEWGLLTRPSYNGEELDFLCEAMRAPDAVGVDIGCNIGLYALPMARSGGRVIAIDANDLMLERLRFNADASNLSNVNTVHAAVGDHDAMVDLHIRKSDVAIVNVVEAESGSIPMRTLAAILNDADAQRVDALKIDIEGHEDLAMVPFLKNATQEKLPKRIVIERASVHGDYPGCTKEFARLGYRLVTQTRNNSLYLLDG